jgi:uncharacterized protein (DUF362 family)
MDRRDFLKAGAIVAGTMGAGGLLGCKSASQEGGTAGAPPPVPQASAPASATLTARPGRNRVLDAPANGTHAAVATGATPAEMVAAALTAIGGIGAFVQQGDVVVIKPNLAWARPPEGGATTSPEVLKAVVSLAQQAGAKTVLVVDHTCDQSASAFAGNGAEAACEEMGVKLVSLDNAAMFREQQVPDGTSLKTEMLPFDILDCDCYINLPCLKHHSATNASLALKNQMGAVLDPNRYHTGGLGLHQNIADLATILRPTLTIIDATRALTTNGPKGPGEVKQTNTIIASHDMVLADTLGIGLLNYTLDDVPHIGLAATAGAGSTDISRAKIARV